MHRSFLDSRRIGILTWLAVTPFLVPTDSGSAQAAEFAKPVRIGVLTESWGPPPAVNGLRQGLTELGYRENEDFVVGVRFTQGDISVLPTVAKETIDHGVDIVLTLAEMATLAVVQVTRTHPIVFIIGGDPIDLGVVDSYARPGGNVTGVTDFDLVVSGKRLQLFNHLVPDLRRVLFPYNGRNAYQVAKAARYRDAAAQLGLILVEQKLDTMGAARAVLANVSADDIDGILSPRNVDLNIPGFILEAAQARKIPSMFDGTFYLNDGGLASYGPSWYEAGRQLARLVDKIIRGAHPSEIPVEIDQSLEFAINLDAAQALELEIAPEMLFQADRIIQHMVE